MARLDLDKVCRICLQTEQSLEPIAWHNNIIVQLFSSFEESCSPFSHNRNCKFSFKVIPSKQQLPANACHSCIEELARCSEVREKIRLADSILRKQIDPDTLEDSQLSDDEGCKAHSVATEEEYFSPHRKESDSYIALQRALDSLLSAAPSPMKKYGRDCKDAVCYLCGKKFNSKAQLTRHLKTHTGIKSYACKLCNKAYMESGSLSKHIDAKHSSQGGRFTCHECRRAFDLKSTLERHTRTHTGERPYGCDVCHRYYPSNSYLNKHKKIHSRREKAFVCEICSKLFASREGLKAHMQAHTSEKTFSCKMCSKCFSTKGALKSHVNYMHIKDKKFICQICGKTFISKGEIHVHMRKHTGEKRTAPYDCYMCDKKVTTTSQMKIHIMSKHTNEHPYKCSFCPKGFVTSHALKMHTRYHSGDRPFKCGHCEKAFVTKEAKKVHERIHTGERPFVCNSCGASFTQSSTLKTHMKGRH